MRSTALCSCTRCAPSWPPVVRRQQRVYVQNGDLVVLDARACMLRLSKDRERSAYWQKAAQLLLEHGDVAVLVVGVA
jgi:hypothetical protein